MLTGRRRDTATPRVAISVLSSLIGCVAFNSSLHLRESALVPRLTLEEYHSSPVHDAPVLVSVASPETIESMAHELMDLLGQEMIQIQHKVKYDGGCKATDTELYDVTLRDSIEYMMDSSHGSSYFAFCEGLLPSATPALSGLSDRLRDAREAPFRGRENWFDYFPQEMRPTDAVILAGAGAVSTLHRDPFEWTGTSLCLEGTKIWRFIAPPPPHGSGGGVAAADEALGSYRLDSIAWEDDTRGDVSTEPIVLSAGWQSDMTLFDSIDEDFPSVFDWVRLEEADKNRFLREMEDAGMDATRIQPSADALHALDRIGKMGTPTHSNGCSPAPPLFATAIQQPGDLLLIPAHWWHQTYAPLPSVAVASQRCGTKVDGANVIRHVLKMANCEEDAVPDLLRHGTYDEGAGKEVIKVLFNSLVKQIPSAH